MKGTFDMELREFIKETLVSIAMGVQEAINAHREEPSSVGAINPVWGADSSAINADHKQNVEFDVAVTVTGKNSTAGKAGIKIFSALDIGGTDSRSLEQSSVSRIKFTIPIVPAVEIVNGPIKDNKSEPHPIVTPSLPST
ncbi:hypothetical protein [Neokomagataea anthophila]|uniref:HK97 gp10 family phage protein n=1 Tax=Neokomagataea anthophila TaxID=2826925 RepID=A0ABS5E9Z8_9PROT|nr:hypothetical protein [Neokomagataea anthophila]MBR0560743.1 hypothetical protein [Neokomagataea anthophila]